MARTAFGVVAGMLMAAGTVVGAPTLQLDVNSIRIQIENAQGGNSAFGGLAHTGSVNFSLVASTVLDGVLIRSTPGGAFNNAGFSGSISNYTGVINLVNGHVTGGHLGVFVNGGTDSYTCNIVPNVGQVSTYVGGGFKIEGLTVQGAFSDASFGNVDVSPWFNSQGAGALPGSFLQFNFDPNASGAGFADMDMFVDVVPLPPAAWTGLAVMAGVMTAGYIRRRRRR